MDGGRWERDNGGARFAAKYLTDAVSPGYMRLSRVSPCLYAEQLLRQGEHDQATALVADLLTRRTTDEAFDALGLWADRLTQADVPGTRCRQPAGRYPAQNGSPPRPAQPQPVPGVRA